MKKRALVLDGGAMKASFMAGIFLGFRQFGIKPDFFDCYVGTSGGACDIAYFLTGQLEQGTRIWCEHLPNLFFKGRGPVPYNNMRNLEKVLREIEPLDVRVLQSCNQQAYLPLANSETAELEFVEFSKAQDPIAVLLAGCSMPFYSGSKKLGLKSYFDGGLLTQPPLDFVKGKDFDEIWVLMAYPEGRRNKPWLFASASWVMSPFNRKVRNLIANCPKVTNPTLEEIEARTDLKIIRPKQDLALSWRSTDKRAIKQTLELGKITALDFLSHNKIV